MLFAGRKAVLAVPAEKLLRGIVELGPIESGAPIDQVARMEFARVHNRDPQSFEMVYWMLPPSPARQGRSQLLAAACAAVALVVLPSVRFDAVERDAANAD